MPAGHRGKFSGRRRQLTREFAAFISAASATFDDDASSNGHDELNFSFSAATSPDPDIIAILNFIDTNDDSALSPNEVIAAVQDEYDGTVHFGLIGLADAFAAMNNQPHPGANDF